MKKILYFCKIINKKRIIIKNVKYYKYGNHNVYFYYLLNNKH